LPIPVLLLVIPVTSTLIGGLVAVRFRHLTDMLVACGAGLLLGAAFLDLMPEGHTAPAERLARSQEQCLSFIVFETAWRLGLLT
jgi:zinc transporter ZupT